MSRKLVSYSDIDDPNHATLINANPKPPHSNANKRQRRNPASVSSSASASGNGHQPNSDGNSNANIQRNRNGNPNSTSNKGKKSKRGGRGGVKSQNHSVVEGQNGNDQSWESNHIQASHSLSIGNQKGKGRESDSEYQNRIANGSSELQHNVSKEVEMGGNHHLPEGEAKGGYLEEEEGGDYNDGEYDEGGDYYEGEEEEGDGEYLDEDDPSLAEAGDAFLASIHFFPPESNSTNSTESIPSSHSNRQSKRRVQGGSKPLTKSQVWDDSSLINAWDAAVEEYQEFHSRRSKYRSQQAQNQSQGGNQNKKVVDSPLWKDSPSIHSDANSKAIENVKSDEVEKREAQKLKEAVRYGKETAIKVSNQSLQNGYSDPKEASAGSKFTDQTESIPSGRNQGSGLGSSNTYSITSSLMESAKGNRAWKEACEEISKSKPIRIGSELVSSSSVTAAAVPSSADFSSSLNSHSSRTDQRDEQLNSSLNASSSMTTDPTLNQHPVPPIPLVGDENLQNMIMAWYYAGYYTGVQQGLSQAQK